MAYNKKEVKAEVLKRWPDVPEEILEEAFYFKNEPSADEIINVGRFAVEVGTTFGFAKVFGMCEQRIVRIEKILVEKFGDEAADCLAEIKENFQKMIGWASLWTVPHNPLQYSPDWSGDVHLHAALKRNMALMDEMYGSDTMYLDDGRSVAEYRAAKNLS